MELVTKAQLVKSLGKSKTLITDELVENINKLIVDEPEVGSMIKDNFITYTGVLQQGKYSLELYLNAVKYVSYKLMNMTNLEAYKATYPERVERLHNKFVINEGYTEDEFNQRISAYVYAIAKSKLVTSILSQVQIPTKLLNMGLLQEAINVEATLMRTARSETVREKAANTLISYLGDDDTNRVQLDIGYKKDEIIDQYEQAMKKMVEEQLVQIHLGGDVKAIANAEIIEVEDDS